jgi:hypothetical protein
LMRLNELIGPNGSSICLTWVRVRVTVLEFA